jgi:hypothetical protein
VSNNPARGLLRVGLEWVLYSIILSLIGLGTAHATMCSIEQTNSDLRVEQAIRKLWSADNNVRELGRKEVLQIGSIAAGALVDLLADLVKYSHPRFVLEGEEEGQKALKAYVDLVRRDREIADNSKDFLAVKTLAINGRLISDAMSLLGDLRAVEGVPILIHIMENRETGTSEPAGIELEALCKIGSPAVPSVIRAIENARMNAKKAFFRRSITFGFVISFGPEDDLEDTHDNIEADGLYNDMVLDTDEEIEVERKAFRIKQKAIRVLGEIGDNGALPFLERLTMPEASAGTLISSVLEAIRKIKNEPVPGFGPKPTKRVPMKED